MTRKCRHGRAWSALDDERGDALSSTTAGSWSDASSRAEEERGSDARPGTSGGISES